MHKVKIRDFWLDIELDFYDRYSFVEQSVLSVNITYLLIFAFMLLSFSLKKKEDW